MNVKTDVSVIIVNYNTKVLTENCIDSIVKHTTDINYEIILVDNASSDGSIEYFENFNNIKFIKSEKNLGFGRANNLGYKHALGKYIFLLNSDTIFLNNVLKILYQKMEELSQNVAFIGCPLLSHDGISYTTSYGTFPKISEIFKALRDLYYGKFIKPNINNNSDLPIDKLPLEVDYITGADLFMRKNIIDQFGLFDSDFFMYFEETELQNRYNKLGYKSILVSGPQIIHLEPSLKNLKKKKYTTKHRYIFFEGMFIYFKKEFSFTKYFLWRLLNLGYLPTVFTTVGTISDKLKLFLLFFGVKTIKH